VYCQSTGLWRLSLIGVGIRHADQGEKCGPIAAWGDRISQPRFHLDVARFRETSRGHIMRLNSGMMKMIFSTRIRRLLGVHILGEDVTELILIGQPVLNLKGTIDYFIRFNYPALAEACKIAGLDAWNRMTR
jgi:hypothetical protein